MSDHRATTRGRRGLLMLALVAAVVGAVLVVVAATSQQPAPPQLASPRGDLPSTTSTPPSTSTAPPAAPPTADPEDPTTPQVEPADDVPLGPSEPVAISIPAIQVDSQVFSIGKAPDGSLAVPQPGPNLDKAAWFEVSPTPGQPGPSIIEGHVATEQRGPSVFFDLAELEPGDRIRVDREDGTRVVFEVDALRKFDKDEFPTELVYGGNISEPTLRLITCTDFDAEAGDHTANLVVFSHLARVQAA